MHVKLEVETQPLTNLWVKLRRVLKLISLFAAIIVGNLVLAFFLYDWTTDFATTHHKNPQTGQLLAIAIPALLLILCLASLFTAKWEAEQEARWRSTE